jgi:hypothetical protein
MVADGRAQTYSTDPQDDELDCLQQGGEAPREYAGKVDVKCSFSVLNLVNVCALIFSIWIPHSFVICQQNLKQAHEAATE